MRPKIKTRNPWQFMAGHPPHRLARGERVRGRFITDQDLHFEGAALIAPYKVGAHRNAPEYYSQQMLDGLDGYLEKGGRLMYWAVTASTGSRRWIRAAVHRAAAADGTEEWEGAPGESHHA